MLMPNIFHFARKTILNIFTYGDYKKKICMKMEFFLDFISGENIQKDFW